MSATSAGEFSWLQKFMSAVTYVVAFLIGGLLCDVTDVMDSDRVGALGMRSLVTVLVLTIILEGALSFTDNLTAMTILSYKSASLISFALAAACSALCGNPTQCLRQSADCRCHRHLIDRHAWFLCDAVTHQ